MVASALPAVIVTEKRYFSWPSENKVLWVIVEVKIKLFTKHQEAKEYEVDDEFSCRGFDNRLLVLPELVWWVKNVSFNSIQLLLFLIFDFLTIFTR